MTIATTAVEVYEQLAPALGVVVPPVVALAVKANAGTGVKRVTVIAVTALAAVLSLAGEDWSSVDAGLVAGRLLLTLGEAQAVYMAAQAAVERFTGHGSINDLEVFRPLNGVG